MAAERSTKLLILSNLFVTVLAVVQHWQVIELLWVYWLQNIIIGFFNWRRILNKEDFGLDKDTNNKKTAKFFLIHYGFFHLGYLVFLIQRLDNTSSQVLLHGAIGLAIFFLNHYYSYRHNRELDDAMQHTSVDAYIVFFFPYLRVIPMHLVIGFAIEVGELSWLTLLFFLLLKTVADVLMHIIGHTINRKRMKMTKDHS